MILRKLTGSCQQKKNIMCCRCCTTLKIGATWGAAIHIVCILSYFNGLWESKQIIMRILMLSALFTDLTLFKLKLNLSFALNDVWLSLLLKTFSICLDLLKKLSHCSKNVMNEEYLITRKFCFLHLYRVWDYCYWLDTLWLMR